MTVVRGHFSIFLRCTGYTLLLDKQTFDFHVAVHDFARNCKTVVLEQLCRINYVRILQRTMHKAVTGQPIAMTDANAGVSKALL